MRWILVLALSLPAWATLSCAGRPAGPEHESAPPAQAALESYRKALALKPDDLLARSHLGDALKELGRYEEAYLTYEQVLELEPTDARELAAFDDALYQMGLLDLEMGATQRAAEILAQLVESVPDHPNAHQAYSRALTALGQQDAARQELAKHEQLLAARRSAAGKPDEPASPPASVD